MWHTTPYRVLGAIFAVILTASACGSDAATETASADDASTEEAMSDDEMSEEAMSDDEMSDDEMSETDHGEEHGDHDDGDEHGDDHGATTIDVDPSNPIPEVAMILNETDEPGIFDLRVILANFTITPENIDGEPVDNEGHMHLLIDGEKVQRFTDLELQIKVPEGEHLVEVELNANNHSAYAIDGTPIRTGMTVTGAGEASNDDHDHDHDHSDANAAVEDGLSAADADATITASYADGAVSLDGEDRVEVATGDVVMIMISSDVAEEAHLHGYDILADVGPDADGMILFTADTPGRFEIEFEQSGAFIAELVVS